jgi:hypothetical protein
VPCTLAPKVSRFAAMGFRAGVVALPGANNISTEVRTFGVDARRVSDDDESVDWQIRDPRFGLDIYEAETGWQALAAFLVASERGDIAAKMKDVHVDDDGTVSVTYRGRRFYAVPRQGGLKPSSHGTPPARR